MTELACPMGTDHEPLRHPEAMFCLTCVRRLPQRLRRAIRRVNEGKASRPEVLQRCLDWLERRDAGILLEPPRPALHLRYTSESS